MVLKTTFGQFQRWSLIRGTLGVENEEKNNLNLQIRFLIDKMSLFQVLVIAEFHCMIKISHCMLLFSVNGSLYYNRLYLRESKVDQ